MNSKRIISFLAALTISCCAYQMLERYSAHNTIAYADSSTESLVLFDEESGLLIIKGEITEKHLDFCRKNKNLKMIAAIDDAVMPEECEGLFTGCEVS